MLLFFNAGKSCYTLDFKEISFYEVIFRDHGNDQVSFYLKWNRVLHMSMEKGRKAENLSEILLGCHSNPVLMKDSYNFQCVSITVYLGIKP